jgi:transcription antitermination factor NusA-like protein
MYGILPVSEQVPREILKPGEKYFFYIKDVKHSAVND